MANSCKGEGESFSNVDACYCCQCNDAVFAVLKLNGCVVFRRQGGDDVGQGQKLLGESDNFRAAPDLMVYDTGATPIMSPNPAFNYKERQQGVADLQQPVSGEPQPRGELTRRSSTKTFTSSLGLIPSGEANFCWGKSKDVVPPHWSSGLSAIEPGLTANTTTASSVGCSRVLRRLRVAVAAGRRRM